MSKGKKIALIVSMVAVLVVAAVLNVTLLSDRNKAQAEDPSVQTSFFATSRLDRQTTRNYEIAELNQIIAMEGDEYAEMRQNALAKKQQIVDAMEMELLLETLLKAQGFSDVLVTINADMNNVSVLVDKDELNDDEAIRIFYIINAEASIGNQYVKILPV